MNYCHSHLVKLFHCSMNTCNTDYISILNFWNCLRAYFWAYNRRTSPMLFVFQAQCSAQIKIKIKNIFETHNRWIYCWVPNIQTISFDLFFPHHPLYAERVLALGVAGDISVNYYSNKSLPVHYSFLQTTLSRNDPYLFWRHRTSWNLFMATTVTQMKICWNFFETFSSRQSI